MHEIRRSFFFESACSSRIEYAARSQQSPDSYRALHRLVRDIAGAIKDRESEVERLQSIIKQLQRAQFGRRSERLDPDQLALGLEDLDSDLAREEENRPQAEKQPTERYSHRKPLPDHLPREDVRLDIDSMICACCGGALHVIGENVSETLDWIPAQLRVIRTTRPKYACRSCETVVQVPAPERVIAGGVATPALLAQVLVSKYCDHTPLYRQSQIFARQGVDLPRSTLAGWVGGACWWLEALHERLCKNVFASDHLFADDTPVPVLDPGPGRTKTGRLWVYAREQRGWSGPEPPTAVYLVVYQPLISMDLILWWPCSAYNANDAPAACAQDVRALFGRAQSAPCGSSNIRIPGPERVRHAQHIAAHYRAEVSRVKRMRVRLQQEKFSFNEVQAAFPGWQGPSLLIVLKHLCNDPSIDRYGVDRRFGAAHFIAAGRSHMLQQG